MDMAWYDCSLPDTAELASSIAADHWPQLLTWAMTYCELENRRTYNVILFACLSDDGYYRSFDGPSLVPSQDVTHLSQQERIAMEEEWRAELARVHFSIVVIVKLSCPCCI